MISADICGDSAMKGELLLLSSMIFLLQGARGCPENCHCHSSSSFVDCSQQGLAEIPTDLPATTLWLNLQDNQIHQIPAFAFQSVPQLTTLNLANNSLSHLSPAAFQGLPHLQVLNLTQNSLFSLDNTIFHSLPELRELDLSSNSISHLPTSLSETWENLTVFAVQHNRLQHLDRALLESMPSVKLLYLKDNLWKCNCHLLRLKLWLEKFIYKGGITDGIVCRSPDPWKGEKLLAIPHELYQPCLLPSPDAASSWVQQPGSAHRGALKPTESHGSECELKPKPRPANLRHAIATVIITGVVCGIVCLMMLAAAIYGCAYAAITAQYQGRPLAPNHEPGKAEGKGLFDSSPA
ncbi:leucine-rich repeat and transmembrane domain-containing protein 1 [Ochotona curzoniae]|uniref:leucine-rich repeat and transmembrane domain-containing protein 1 n=1 Tax=Ochotona curzoniae TaxID=130825 RepID=UPI001B346AA5|nr:leucine-rich repeat and transmembrane domain-containing protein 1 [Ochotona curzoniae]